MTVLEKIKRCVSLVWDFQEIYGEEDIEDFCHYELSTYPQHDEIMEYFKQIEELEKENAELKETIKYFNPCSEWNDDVHNCEFRHYAMEYGSQLTKAKVVLRNVIDYLGQFCSDYPDCVIEAEQFLNSEVEK